LNVDAAGLGQPCAPDGVCDGNDAFAALNCFGQTTPCTCDGPAPASDEPARTQRGVARLSAHAAMPWILPGQTVSVDVYLEDGLDDLRGYQLHLQSAGGESGRLELVDIALHEPGVFSSNKIAEDSHSELRTRNSELALEDSDSAPGMQHSALPYWSAFNLHTGQMVAGLNTDGVPAPSGAYLATFTYRASKDAAGTFTIEILADPQNAAQRTVLFPTPADGWVNVESTSSALVEVRDSRTDHPRARRL
jgi:hypothetical protein